MTRRDARSLIPGRPDAARRGAVSLVTVVVVVGLTTGLTTRTADAGPVVNAPGHLTLSDPTTGHAYRHGAVPLRVPTTSSASSNGPRGVTSRRPTTAGPVSRDPVRSGGGSVVTGSPKVYLVFWGSQWGMPSTNGAGDQVYSGDPDRLAPNLQAFFRGLGTNNEPWSAILTQYCQGVASGAKTCPLAPPSDHIGYPSGTVLGGVWEDTTATLPAATAQQIAQEAATAAQHFSNPLGAQYVIVSATGTDPDHWRSPRSGYCAYHDHTQDPSLGTVSGPDVPYTNMPYVPDVGSDCSSFNHPAALDGADETISHEYAEVLTDPLPSTGWSDRTGREVADKCENLIGGTPGGSTYVPLATGTFAVQGIWANDLGKRGGCETAHAPILTVNPSRQRVAEGTAVSVPIGALDVRGRPLTYSAAGLPAGLAINATSGLISGIPVARGRASTSVAVSDGVASSTVAFVWNVRG